MQYTALVATVLALVAFAAAVPYAGKISISEVGPLTMYSGMNRTIQFTLSQPIICINQTVRRCGVVVLISNTNPNEVYIDNCAVKWNKDDWWQPRFIRVVVKPTFVDRAMMNVTLITNAPITDAPFYNTSDANPADIALQTQSRPSKTCSGVGDPHYSTFDGLPWHFYEASQQVFYGSNNPTRIFEAQARTMSQPYAWHCGLAVREGNGVAFVDQCYGRNLMDVRGTGVTLTSTSSGYLFQTSGGSELRLQGSALYATAPGTDYGLTYGMCGNNNGIASDDAPVGPNGVVWTVSGLFPSQTMAGRTDLFSWRPSSGSTPVITPPRSDCNYTDEPYVPPVIITPVVDITDLLKNHSSDSDPTLPPFSIGTTPAGVTNTPMTEVAARAQCAGRINASPIVQICVTQLNLDVTLDIENCVRDFVLNGAGDVWVNAAVESIQDRCQLVAQQLGRVDDPAVNDALCLTANTLVCSGFGTCVNRTCVCNAGRLGGDCMLNTAVPPTLAGIVDNLCDTIGRLSCPDSTVLVSGANFINTPSLTCLFGNASTPAQYVSKDMVLCGFPRVMYVGFPEKRVRVKVSNNGQSFSNAVDMIYYDSRCTACANSQCGPNPESCVVGGQCYLNNQGSPDNACLICNVASSPSRFSYDYSHSVCQPDFSAQTYIIRVVGSGSVDQVIGQVNGRANQLVANDTTNTITYSIASNLYFDVNPTSGAIVVKRAFNVTYAFTVAAPATLTVTATDSHNTSDTATLLFEYLETATAAVFSQSDYNATIPENSAVGTYVTTIVATAPSGTVTYAWYIQPQSFAGALRINATSGVVSVDANIDFEAVPVGHDGRRMLTFLAKATTSNGLSAQVGLHLYITNVNENPTAIVLAGNSVDENAPADTLVGLFTTVDPDSDNTFTYTLVTPNVPFKIVSGHLMTDGSVIDFENVPTSVFSITVRSTDQGGLSVTASFNITINNVNEPPFNIQATGNLSIPETVAVGTPLDVFFTAQDPENDAVECGLMGTGDDVNFLIFNNRLVLAAPLDYRTRQSYTIQVICADRGTPSMLSAPRSFVVNVLDMPQPPQLLPIPIILAPQFQEVDPSIGSGTIAVPTLVPGTGFSTPSGGSGSSSPSPSTTAGSGSATTTTITTTAAPVAGIPENIPSGTVIGVVRAVDPDSNAGNFTFTIAPDQRGAFAIVNTTCQPRSAVDGSVTCTATIATVSDHAFDFEDPTTHEIRVLVTDKTGQTTQLVVPVNVVNRNDPPSVPTWATEFEPSFVPGAVQEDSPIGTYLGTLLGHDEDPDQTLFMQIVSPLNDFFRLTPLAPNTDGNNVGLNGRRRRDAAAGATPMATPAGSRSSTVTLGANANLDYETSPLVTLVLNVSDNGVPPQWTLVTMNITVTNKPMALLLDGRATDNVTDTWMLAENEQIVGELSVSGLDVDNLDEVITLTESYNGTFSLARLSRNHWELRARAMDYETATTTTFFVGMQLSFMRGNTPATDIPSIQRNVRVSLTNVDEPPVFVTVQSVPVQVNTDDLPFSVVFSGARATDPDHDVVTYTLVDTLNIFAVNSTTGAIYPAGPMDAVPLQTGHSRNVSLQLTARSTAPGKSPKTTSTSVVITLVDNCFGVDCAALNKPGPCIDQRNAFTCTPTTEVAGGAGASSADSSNSSSNAGMIAGIAVGLAVLVAALAFLGLVIYRRRQKPLMLESSQYATVNSLDNPSYGLMPGSPAKGGDSSLNNPLYKWYMPDMTRADAEDFLLDQEEGSFVVRDSTATPGWHMIAVKTKESIVHEKIKMSEDGMYELLPSSNRKQPKFTALPDLIEHYAKPQDGVRFALYVDNPLYDNSQLMERKTGRAVAAAWHHDNDPSAPMVPLKQKERMQVTQLAGLEDDEIYTNTNEAKNALSVV